MAKPSPAVMASIGAGVAAAAALPGAIGAYQIKDTGRSVWSNGWLVLAISLWLLGDLMVLGVAAQVIRPSLAGRAVGDPNGHLRGDPGIRSDP